MAYRINPKPVEEVGSIDPRIAQRQAQIEAQRQAAALAAVKQSNANNPSWNPSGRTGGTTSTGDVRVYGKEESVYTPPAAPAAPKNTGYNNTSYTASAAPVVSTPVAAPTYAEIPEYRSKYADAIEELANKLLNREAFSYDPMNDPAYQNYEKQYTRMGARAMEDMLGRLSGKTGGMASSYATSAAHQANNAYMAELSDIIPELRQLAYSMYMDEGDDMLGNLNTLIGMDTADYSRYRDEVEDINRHNQMLAEQYEAELKNRSTSSKSSGNSSIESSLNFLVDSGAIDADTAASIYLGNLAGGTQYVEEQKRKTHSQGGR